MSDNDNNNNNPDTAAQTNPHLSFPERNGLADDNLDGTQQQQQQQQSSKNNNNNSTNNNNNSNNNNEAPATPMRNKKKKQPLPKKKESTLPPMMRRREVSMFNIIASVLCLLLAPGLLVCHSMLASTTAFLAPYGETTLGPIAAIFLIISIFFFILPVYFLVFSGSLFASYTISTKPDEIVAGEEVTKNNEPFANDDDDDDEQQQNEENNKNAKPIDPATQPLPESKWYQSLLRWVLRILLIIFILICIGASLVGVVMYSMKVNVPKWDNDFSRVRVPSGNHATLQRDKDGIVHIFADTRRDYYFAFGFAQAQDRLFQLELSRLVGRGTLAKYTGTSGLDIDKLMRTLRVKESADKLYNDLSSTMKQYIQDFTDGVNSYLVNDFARPGEFLFIGTLLEYHEPEPFVPQDVLLIAKLLQYQLSSAQLSSERRRTKNFFSSDFPGTANYENFEAYFYDRLFTSNTTTPFSESETGVTIGDSAYNTAISEEVSSFAREKRLYDEVLFPKYRTSNSIGNSRPDSREAQVQEQQQAEEEGKQSSSSSTLSEQRQRQKSPRSSFLGLKLPRKNEYFFTTKHILDSLIGDINTFSDASNAWAARTANGNAVHASDPHLANNVPCVWYFSHAFIKDENFHISGGTPVGLPTVLNGRTSNVRFGNTLSLTDQGDLFFMEADTANPDTHYMHNGVSKAYTVYTESIEVHGESDPTVIKVYESAEYGPDVVDVFELISDKKSKKASDGTTIRICAFINAFKLADTTTVEAMFNLTLSTTTTVTQVRDLALKFISPGLGMVISDDSGGIGTVITGTQKIRADGHTGRVPTLGNGTFDYTGDVPANENPNKVDTATATNAFVWAANSRPHPTGYKYNLGYDFRQYRSRVIDEELTRIQSASPADLSRVSFHQKMQYNQTSGMWAYAIVTDLQLTVSSSTNGAQFFAQLNTAGTSRWNHLINNWNGVASIGSTEISDLWLWIYSSTTQADPIIANDYDYQDAVPVYEYFMGLVGKPTPRQKTFCGEKLAETSPYTDTVCVRWVASVWNSLVSSSNYCSQKWASKDSNIFHKVTVEHLAVHGSIVQGIFSREMTKGGDPTAIDILKLNKGDSDDNPDNTPYRGYQGPSGRWVFQNVVAASNNLDESNNDNVGFYYNIPAGNSGHLFSKYYFDGASDYENGVFRKVRHFVSPPGGEDADNRQLLGKQNK